MIIARIVSGIGMGFINSTVPVMQAEFSPKATRGMYVCAQLSTLNFGKSLVNHPFDLYYRLMMASRRYHDGILDRLWIQQLGQWSQHELRLAGTNHFAMRLFNSHDLHHLDHP